MSQGSHSTYRRFIAWLQPVQRVNAGAYERVDHIVVFKHTHQGAESDRTHELVFRIRRCEQVDHLAILQSCRYSHVSMLAVSCHAFHRLRHEGHFQPVHAENISYDIFDLVFVISSLYSRRILPVDFQLFHNMIIYTGVSQFCFYATDFFMTHLHFKSVFLQDQHGFFQCSTNRSGRPFPILFLQHLSRGQLFSVGIVIRGLYPEFQFCSCRDDDLIDIIYAVRIDVLKHVRVVFEKFHQIIFKIPDSIPQDHSGSNAFRIIMHERRRDPQCSYRKTRIRIRIVEVVIHKPVDRLIRYDVHLRIIQLGDLRQHYAGSVRLHSMSKEFIHILQKFLYRDLFVGIMPANVDPYQGNELDFRVLPQNFPDFFRAVLISRYRIKHFVQIV